MEKLSASGDSHDQKSRDHFVLSLWPPAPHLTQLRALPTATRCLVDEKPARTKRAETRPPSPSFCRPMAARALSSRGGPPPLSLSGLCHCRTVGGQSVQKTPHLSANPPREFTHPKRLHWIYRGTRCLASCLWANRGTVSAWG